VFLAQVIGTVVSPVQHPVLDGRRLLLVRALTPHGEPSGRTRIAIDHARAGVGDRVLVVDEGKSARAVLGLVDAPVKTVVVAVVDYVELGGKLVFDARHTGEGHARSAR
jgi:microcompartment protein CcmK/EutM